MANKEFQTNKQINSRYPQYLLNPVNIYEFLLPPLISANTHYPLLIPTAPLISTNSDNPHPISNILLPPLISANPHYPLLIPTAPLNIN